MKILVAEDNLESRYLLERFFSEKGHQVVAVSGGHDGIDEMRRECPDVVVSDALMPGLDGFEFCHRLKASPEFFRIPFIFYTATYTDESDEKFALRVGADCFIVKPVEPDKLMIMIEETVARVRANPRAQPMSVEKNPDFFEEHSRRVSLKLELKLAELHATNQELRNSERSIRLLNERLVSTVRALEEQVIERQAAEAALRVREAVLRHAQTIGRIGSWERALDSEKLICSDETMRIFGVEPGSVTITSAWVLERTHPDDRQRLASELRAAEQKCADLDIEHRLVWSDGAIRHVFVRRQMLRDNEGRPMRFVGIIQDITDRKEAEAQRTRLEAQLRQAQKMEAIGNLAGGIAHDFNNILTAIMAHAELLELELPRAATGDHMRESAGEIVSAAARARDLVKQILTFSRKQAVERKRLVLSSSIQEALKLVRSTLPRAVEIKTNLDTRGVVLANEGQIHQIVLNLCTNAAQAMGERGGLIEISLAQVELDEAQTRSRPPLRIGGHVRMDVRDTGPGMSSAVLERIFEPFFTTKPVGQGTGLGLAVVHGIVQAHDGAIFVESKQGQGTTFSIFLPVAKGEPEAAGGRTRAPGSGKGQKVLFVDDEPSVAKIGVRLLERLGYEAIALTDAVVARERLVSNPYEFDLVITDYLMPRVTGLDLARAVWAVRADLPMILAVGFGGQLDAVQARAHGFREFIAKPFALQTLAEAISKSLNK